MTYLELKDLIRNLRLQFHAENAAARKNAERNNLPRPAPRSFYDYVAHTRKWRYVLTAHGIGRADLDGHEEDR